MIRISELLKRFSVVRKKAKSLSSSRRRVSALASISSLVTLVPKRTMALSVMSKTTRGYLSINFLYSLLSITSPTYVHFKVNLKVV